MDAGEHVSLACEARIPRIEGELEGDGAGVLLARAHGAVDVTVRALAVMLQHGPPVYLGAWRASPRADALRHAGPLSRPEGGRAAIPIRDEPAESS